MTRPKVPPDQRQRTAQACESCKRRKQKCNGLQPCNTCSKRNFQCIYIDRNEPVEKSNKKPRLSVDKSPGSISSPTFMKPDQGLQLQFSSGPGTHHYQSMSSTGSAGMPPITVDEAAQRAARNLQQYTLPPRTDIGTRSRSFLSIVTGPFGGHEGEALVYGEACMLKDINGRWLYIGDSGLPSFIQLLRRTIEPAVGKSPFTEDPRAHVLTEAPLNFDLDTKTVDVLPDIKTAKLLTEYFFINTHGIINIFGRDPFLNALEKTYEDPLNIDSAWLCQVNLVFAIGFLLANPKPKSEENTIVTRLRDKYPDLDERFFIIARRHNDPLNGIEESDFWSIQALLLMSIYMLCKSKRNSAYVMLRTAIGSAYSLGLHREDSMVVSSPEEKESRRGLWKSLFVMDKFLALSLGRPAAIFEDYLYTSNKSQPTNGPSSRNHSIEGYAPDPTFQESMKYSTDATVKICSVISKILKNVFQHRKISTQAANELAQECKEWESKIAPSLRSRSANLTSSHGISILHCNLFWQHSVILLTRPFFLFNLTQEVSKRANLSRGEARKGLARIQKFSEVCVSAATHTVNLVQTVYQAGFLPRRNPWVIYFLASAAFVLQANDFIPLHKHHSAEKCILDATRIMKYCGSEDLLACRMLEIMQSFQTVLNQERAKRQPLPTASKHQAVDSLINPLGFSTTDPSLLTQQPISPSTAAPATFAQPQYYPQTTSSTPTSGFPSLASGGAMPTTLDPAMTNPNMPFANLLDFNFGTPATGDQYLEELGPHETLDFDTLWSWNNGPGPTETTNMDMGWGLQVS